MSRFKPNTYEQQDQSNNHPAAELAYKTPGGELYLVPCFFYIYPAKKLDKLFFGISKIKILVNLIFILMIMKQELHTKAKVLL